VGAVVESFAEQMFFSIGNPASLMFLLSIAMLTQGGSPESAPPTHESRSFSLTGRQ
jgi:hypothetical protein